MRDLPRHRSQEKAHVLDNQLAVRRGIKRRVKVRIFRMFMDKRQPRIADKFINSAIAFTQIVYVQHMPAEEPADKTHVHFDVAEPVHADHVGIRFPPRSDVVAEQDEILQFLARLVCNREMQKELHPVHFPHVLHVADLAVKDIDVVCEYSGETLARQHIEVPVNFLIDIDSGIEYRIVEMGVGRIDNTTFGNGKSYTVIIFREPVKKTVPDKSTYTVKGFPCRNSLRFFVFSERRHCYIIISYFYKKRKRIPYNFRKYAFFRPS